MGNGMNYNKYWIDMGKDSHIIWMKEGFSFFYKEFILYLKLKIKILYEDWLIRLLSEYNILMNIEKENESYKKISQN